MACAFVRRGVRAGGRLHDPGDLSVWSAEVWGVAGTEPLGRGRTGVDYSVSAADPITSMQLPIVTWEAYNYEDLTDEIAEKDRESMPGVDV